MALENQQQQYLALQNQPIAQENMQIEKYQPQKHLALQNQQHLALQNQQQPLALENQQQQQYLTLQNQQPHLALENQQQYLALQNQPIAQENMQIEPYQSQSEEIEKYNPKIGKLPEVYKFICTLCETPTNFSTFGKLENHIKRFHQAFNQEEKGTKRKGRRRKEKVYPKKG